MFHLLRKDLHRCTEEQLAADMGIAEDVDVDAQETLLDSYCSVCDHWRYRFHQAKLETAFKDIDEATDEVYDKSEDEDDVGNSVSATPRRHEAGTPTGVVCSEEK